MTIDKQKELLTGLLVPRNAPHDGMCFSSEYMDKANVEKYAIYTAVSEALHDSKLSQDFGYKIVEKALHVLDDERIDWTDPNMDDNGQLQEAIDTATPIYNNELMQIYLRDWWLVDGANEELGGESDSVSNARRGWYVAIERMVEAIINNLTK